MNVIKRKIHTMLHTPRIFMKKFSGLPVFRLLPDKLALQIMYRNAFLKKLDLKDPKTFNEKLQWLKLYDRKPEYTMMVDKYAVKQYVADLIGEQYIIPTLGVWDRFEDIDFDQLPDQFVLKCTHGSGDTVICRDKKHFDKTAAKERLTKSLNTDYYKISREWPYKNVPRRIIAERFLHFEGNESRTVNDYKFLCFNGDPKYLMVASERNHEKKTAFFDYFDMEFNACDFLQEGEVNSPAKVQCPTCFAEMKRIVRVLANKMPHVRVDLYECQGRVYFGEITLYNAGGFSKFEPNEWDRKLGDLIDLAF